MLACRTAPPSRLRACWAGTGVLLCSPAAGAATRVLPPGCCPPGAPERAATPESQPSPLKLLCDIRARCDIANLNSKCFSKLLNFRYLKRCRHVDGNSQWPQETRCAYPLRRARSGASPRSVAPGERSPEHSHFPVSNPDPGFFLILLLGCFFFVF